MLVVMTNTASKEEIEAVCQTIRMLGFEAHKMPGAQRTAVCVTGNDGSVSERHFAGLTGIRQIIRVSKPYKLTSNEVKTSPTVVQIGEAKFGDGRQDFIVGPACVESEEQALELAHELKALGVKVFRGSAFRPRTNPYNFQGLGEKGLEILAKVREETGLAVVTEVIDVTTLEQVEQVADAIIVDSHNMQNFAVLRRLGKSKKPVILKRSISASLEDFLMAAEYVMSGGNQQVILCDAGERSFGEHSAHALDITFIPALQKLTHLPIIVDPSQASGTSYMVLALTKAVLALGCNGVMIECHQNPAQAKVGGVQAIVPDEIKAMLA